MQLVERLSDGNQRIRDGAWRGLEIIAASNSVGHSAVAHQVVKPLPAKQKTSWRPLSSRLRMLHYLVTTYGVGGSSGISADAILNFSKGHGVYAHSTPEVRDDAKKLVVAIHRHVGVGPLQATLDSLRPKQREEYEKEFENNSSNNINNPSVGNGNGGGGGGGRKGPSDDEHSRVDRNMQHAPQLSGGKVQTTATKVGNNNNDSGQGDDEAPVDFTSCMFCGVRDKNWTENDLDIHYWKDCPLLISCPSCAQIVEIAGLPEHLLDECDAKDSYIPCDVTGDAPSSISHLLFELIHIILFDKDKLPCPLLSIQYSACMIVQYVYV